MAADTKTGKATDGSVVEEQAIDPEISSVDVDAAKLAEMGYTQALERNFSKWSLLCICFALTNSWFYTSTFLASDVEYGGPVVVVYGIIIITCINGCVAVCLAELISAFPNSGGQYYWASVLAPDEWSDLLAYYTGFVGYAGSILFCASIAAFTAASLMELIQTASSEFYIETWMVFTAYQIFNFVAYLFNCYGKSLSFVGKFFFFVSLVSFVSITITVLAKSSKREASFVFATFINIRGWKSNAIIFILGLINSNWSFSCLDSATHLAEEVPHPERNIPFAIMITVVIGFLTSFIYSTSMFFSMEHLYLSSALELYSHATGSFHGANFMAFLVCFTGLGCQIACHTWQARLCWSFARDRGLPGSRYWSQVHPKLQIPFNAHTMSCIVVGILGMFYFLPILAFYSMLIASIVLLYISYSIPVILLLIKGRNNIKHGPFWLGRFGHFCNYVLLVWTLFTLVMYSFPFFKPVMTQEMNYSPVLYAITFIIITVYWIVYGKRTFRSRSEREGGASSILVELKQRTK